MKADSNLNRPRVEVAAGLLVRQGRLLIAKRGEGTHLAGYWEFPGGKREPGENFQQCLVRELQEELGVEVAVEGEPYATVEHDYGTKVVLLLFFRAELLAGEPRAIECAEIAWVGREDLERFLFPPADASLLKRLFEDQQFWEFAG